MRRSDCSHDLMSSFRFLFRACWSHLAIHASQRELLTSTQEFKLESRGQRTSKNETNKQEGESSRLESRSCCQTLQEVQTNSASVGRTFQTVPFSLCWLHVDHSCCLGRMGPQTICLSVQTAAAAPCTTSQQAPRKQIVFRIPVAVIRRTIDATTALNFKLHQSSILVRTRNLMLSAQWVL